MAKPSTATRKQGESRGIRRNSGTVADWEQASGDLIKRAIAVAALTGGALRFGYSRDGGAYSIGIYGDGDPYTEYCKPDEPIDELLELTITLFEEIRDEQFAARGIGKSAPTAKSGD